MLLFRSALNGEAMVGSENSVDMCRYAIVVTRVEEGLDNELTGGWKVIEVSDFDEIELRKLMVVVCEKKIVALLRVYEHHSHSHGQLDGKLSLAEMVTLITCALLVFR